MITYIMNFKAIISTDDTSSSGVHNLNVFEMRIFRIEICLTITNKRKSDAKKVHSLF